MQVLIAEPLKIDVNTVIPKAADGTCCCGWPCEEFQRGFPNWAAVAEAVQVCKGQGGVLCMRSITFEAFMHIIYVFSHIGRVLGKDLSTPLLPCP